MSIYIKLPLILFIIFFGVIHIHIGKENDINSDYVYFWIYFSTLTSISLLFLKNTKQKFLGFLGAFLVFYSIYFIEHKHSNLNNYYEPCNDFKIDDLRYDIDAEIPSRTDSWSTTYNSSCQIGYYHLEFQRFFFFQRISKITLYSDSTKYHNINLRKYNFTNMPSKNDTLAFNNDSTVILYKKDNNVILTINQRK